MLRVLENNITKAEAAQLLIQAMEMWLLPEMKLKIETSGN